MLEGGLEFAYRVAGVEGQRSPIGDITMQVLAARNFLSADGADLRRWNRSAASLLAGRLPATSVLISADHLRYLRTIICHCWHLHNPVLHWATPKQGYKKRSRPFRGRLLHRIKLAKRRDRSGHAAASSEHRGATNHCEDDRSRFRNVRLQHLAVAASDDPIRPAGRAGECDAAIRNAGRG